MTISFTRTVVATTPFHSDEKMDESDSMINFTSLISRDFDTNHNKDIWVNVKQIIPWRLKYIIDH